MYVYVYVYVYEHDRDTEAARMQCIYAASSCCPCSESTSVHSPYRSRFTVTQMKGVMYT